MSTPWQLYSLLSFVAPKIFPFPRLEKFLAAFEDVKGLSVKLERGCAKVHFPSQMSKWQHLCTLF